MIERPFVVVRAAKTYDVKIGDTIWALSKPDFEWSWLLVYDIHDNGYGDVGFRRDGPMGSVADLRSGDMVLIRDDSFTLIPNNAKEGIQSITAPDDEYVPPITWQHGPFDG
jgi:hypothetical protein